MLRLCQGALHLLNYYAKSIWKQRIPRKWTNWIPSFTLSVTLYIFITAHKRNCDKVMFLRLYIILSTRGVYPSMHLGKSPWQTTPPGRHPLLQRTACILLVIILVWCWNKYTHLKEEASGIHGGYRLVSTYNLPDCKPTGGGGVFRSKLWSSQIWSFSFGGGRGLSGLKFQKGDFWRIWTNIYCLRNVYRNLLVHHRLSLTYYVCGD